jgi:hypothetical protein
MHPVEKLMRIGLGTLSVEGLPRGRYRLLGPKEVEALRREASAGKRDDRFEEGSKRISTPRAQSSQKRRERKTPG